MKKISIALICFCTFTLLSCMGSDSDNDNTAVTRPDYVDFTVNGTEYHWNAPYPGFGYIDELTPNYYYNIYISETASDTDTFYDYLFIDIADKTPGSYSSTDDDTNSISYYDALGNAFYDFYSSCYSNITISEWSSNEVSGSFSAYLYSSDSTSYVTIAGTFVSFDDTANKNIEKIVKANSNIIKIKQLK